MKIGSLEVEGGWGGLYVRLPFGMGEAWFGGGLTTFDSPWSIREATKAKKQRQVDEAALVD